MKGRFYEIEQRNKLIRSIYRNLRDTHTREEAIRQLRHEHGYGYLSERSLLNIIYGESWEQKTPKT